MESGVQIGPSSVRGLNFRKAKGRWYVTTRETPSISLIRGFVGTRAELMDALGGTAGIKRRLIDLRGLHKARLHIAAGSLKTAKRRAKHRGCAFDLTMSWLVQRLANSGDRCEVTGIDFDFRGTEKLPNWHRNPYRLSVDRIDSDGGYTRDNCRLVLTAVNYGINEWGLSVFKRICAAMARLP